MVCDDAKLEGRVYPSFLVIVGQFGLLDIR